MVVVVVADNEAEVRGRARGGRGNGWKRELMKDNF